MRKDMETWKEAFTCDLCFKYAQIFASLMFLLPYIFNYYLHASNSKPLSFKSITVQKKYDKVFLMIKKKKAFN